MGRDYTYYFGKFGLNYRGLEKVIKHEAVYTERLNKNWRDISMDIAIDILAQAGKISKQEANELHQLRIARNRAHHEETPTNLMYWVNLSARLLEQYRKRFNFA